MVLKMLGNTIFGLTILSPSCANLFKNFVKTTESKIGITARVKGCFKSVRNYKCQRKILVIKKSPLLDRQVS